MDVGIKIHASHFGDEVLRVRYGRVRHGLVRCGSVRSGKVRFGEVRSGSESIKD